MSQAAVEAARADRVELHRAGRGIGHATTTGLVACAATSAGFAADAMPVEAGEIERQRQQHSAEHHRLAADAVATASRRRRRAAR